MRYSSFETVMPTARQLAYRAYLKTDAWASIREKVLARDNYTCKKCLRNEAEQVHHLTYKNLGNEKHEDLISVCEGCHLKIHENKITVHNQNFYRISKHEEENYVGGKEDISIIVGKLKEIESKREALEASSVKRRKRMFRKMLRKQEKELLKEKKRLETVYGLN